MVEVRVMKKWQGLFGIGIVFLFLAAAVCPSGGSAETQRNEVMEKRCEAAREGTETDAQVKRACASYFEQTCANLVTGVAASAAAPSVSSGERFRTIAALAVGVSTAAGVIASGIVWDTFYALTP